MSLSLRTAGAPVALLVLALSAGCSARQNPPAEPPANPAPMDPAPTLAVDTARVNPAPNIFKPAPGEPVVRNVPYGGGIRAERPAEDPGPPGRKAAA